MLSGSVKLPILIFTFTLIIFTALMLNKESAHTISKEEAIAIVQNDAANTAGSKNLSDYEIIAELSTDGWHIAYISRTPGQRGGGAPEYVIDAKTGSIISKSYQR